VNWSRLTRIGQMVNDDAPKVLRMLALNDGQKPVALDYVRDLWEEARKTAAKERAAMTPPKEREFELQKEREFGVESDGAGGRERTRTPSIEISRGRSGLNL
jgi:dihydroxyacetone kinase